MLELADVFAQTVTLPSDLTVITDEFDAESIGTWDLVTAAVAVVGALVLSRVVRRAVRAFFERLPDAPEATGALVGRLAGWAVIVIGLIIALDALGFDFGPVLTILLVVALVGFLALRPLLENVGAGMLLQARGPFRAGDQIGSNDVDGTVYRVNARAVILTTTDGRRVFVPNSEVIRSSLTNYTELGQRRTHLDIDVSDRADLDLVRELMLRAMRDTEGVRAEPEPEAYVHEFGRFSMRVRVRFWHGPEFRDMWIVRDWVARAIKAELERAAVEMPLPQQTIRLDGRGGAGLSGPALPSG